MPNQPVRRNIIGHLAVNRGDVVCFSFDLVIKLAEQLGRGFGNKKLESFDDQYSDLQDFIREYEGVLCQFNADGNYEVSSVSAISRQGESYDAVLIGAPGGDIQFLTTNMLTYDDWAKADLRGVNYEKIRAEMKKVWQ